METSPYRAVAFALVAAAALYGWYVWWVLA